MLLQGVRVIEMASWVAGPGCAMLMAEWGAEVVKVEPPDGDATRRFFPDTPESPGNPIFSMENRGKRSVALDIRKAAGRDALVRLLEGADVFVTNLRPGALARARLDYSSLAPALPRLVYAHVTGFGLQGEEVDRPAFDITGFWTRTGVAAATIPPDQAPFPCRPGFGDHLTALATLSGVLAALIERGRSGSGRLVEASLLRAGVYALAWDYAGHLRYGAWPTAQPREDRPGGASGFFATADDRWLCIVPRGPACIPALLGALDLAGLADEPRFASPITDLAAARELRGHLDAAFARLDLAEAGRRLTAADLIWAPMASLAEAATDPQLIAAGCFTETPDRFGGRFAAPASPLRMEGMAKPAAAPDLGQHTREVLADAGFSDAEIGSLIASGAALAAEIAR